MKVSLITYFAADNYGATLQAYATIKILEELGCEVELINITIDEPNSIIKKILLRLKHARFVQFRRKYFKRLTIYYSSIQELQKNPPQSDIYIVGSDQTWNPDISRDKVKAFFLDFGNKQIKRISYAASFGKENWEDTNWLSQIEAQELLRQFDAISVRESSGLVIGHGTFGVKSVQVLDPVLLHRNYFELTGAINLQKRIGIYKLVNDPIFYEKARILGAYLNLPLKSIGSLRKLSGIQSNYPESLPDWIRNIAESEYIFTDSFHGTVLSLLYKRPFIVVVGNPKLVTRIQSLLELLGLENRICSSLDSIEKIQEIIAIGIDYNSIASKLEDLREKSIDFLKRNLYL